MIFIQAVIKVFYLLVLCIHWSVSIRILIQKVRCYLTSLFTVHKEIVHLHIYIHTENDEQM